MAQTPITEAFHAGGFIISEANGHRSRERGVITGLSLLAGAVLGMVAHGSAVAAASAGNAGNGTSSAVTAQANGQSGAYRVVFTAATKFEVFDPDGNMIGKGATGVAFATEVGFTITAGGTPFAAGDGFDITVATATAKYAQYDPAGTDGSEVPAGILWDAVDASVADQHATIVKRAAEVNASELVWKSGVTDNQKAAALAVLAGSNGIIAR